jgi:hypothetical protein
MDGRRDEKTSTEHAPRPITSGPVGELASHAAIALVREELAHALSAPMAFFKMLVGELEAGRPIKADHIEIASDEVARLQKLIASLRATPGIRIVPGSLALASAVKTAVRDLDRGAGPPAAVSIDVPGSIVVSVDGTALGFVLYGVVTALAARGVTRVRMTAETPADGAPAATLRIVAEESEASPDLATQQQRPVFAARAWAGSDSDALTFAVARRVARASNMLLRPPKEGDGVVVSLEIPLARAED